ncbi:hypothetical protein FAI41_04865 [Acetobacteraceae bacterium]|nr:hypothetical protein FAI41_04865 [Acetobacteraceae bacterium]
MTSFSAFIENKILLTRPISIFFLFTFSLILPAYAYDDSTDGWTNDRIYSISNNLGWIARHRMNGACGLSLLSYGGKKGTEFKAIPLEFLVDKNSISVRSINSVKNLKSDDEVKVRLRLGQAKYLLPMTAEEDPSIISAELEDTQLKLLIDLLYNSQSLTLEFPNDQKPAYYPLYGIHPLIRSLKDCVYVNGFTDLE